MSELTGRFRDLRRALDLMERELEQETLSQEGLVDLKVAVDNVRGSLLAILTGSRSKRAETQMAEFRVQRAAQLSSNIRSDLLLGLASEDPKQHLAISDSVLALLEGIQIAQRRRVQSQKMETVGALAGGIAHDFNNILTPIHGYLEMALEDVPEHSPTHRDLLDAKHAATRAAQLVRQILTFSRPGEGKKEHGLVQSTVLEAANLLRASIPSSVRLKVAVSEDCPPVLADQIQVHQIVMNLGTNAYHAMQGLGGTLTIRLEPVEFSGDDSRRTDIPPGEYLELSVTDTGSGMDEETLDRLFEPFFTTKEAGQGTGLGLAVVHGIVKDHDGDIVVRSAPGVGSTFSVFLPVTDAPAPVVALAHEPVIHGEGRILLVEDDASIVRMMIKQLGRLGYEVRATSCTTTALEMLRDEPDDFDLVITDYMMPNMTGILLATAMREVRPDLPIILITGNLGQVSEQELDGVRFAAHLTKPLNASRLSATIRAALSREEVARSSA